jgi:hypothetical protein
MVSKVMEELTCPFKNRCLIDSWPRNKSKIIPFPNGFR